MNLEVCTPEKPFLGIKGHPPRNFVLGLIKKNVMNLFVF